MQLSIQGTECSDPGERRRRLLYICDWLPPDFGAVGQYSALFAREFAEDGRDVVLAGLTSKRAETTSEAVGQGTLSIVKLQAQQYDKSRLLRRLVWTAAVNTRLVLRLLDHMRWADDILFTGSPPFFLHWIAPLNVLLRKRLIYRITDFHPECLMAAKERVPAWLGLFYRLTLFWRRRVTEFEALGEDQIERLEEIGIPRSRIRLKRDPAPVRIEAGTRALERPKRAQGKFLLLYSGNWGVAHDYRTFIEAYERHHVRGSGRVVLWLNAVGARADEVETALERRGLPVIRGRPVPLEDLPGLLVTPDAHLITLSDAFVGFVMPSKVYGCIESGKPILFVGSERSDVHRLCRARMTAPYERADVGDVTACVSALERLSSVLAGVSGS